MYVAAGIVVLLFLGLCVLSRKETIDVKVSVLLRWFYRIAVYLYKWACIHQIPFLFNTQVEKDLEKLYPGQNKKQISMEYYVSKLAKSLMIGMVGVLLGVVVSIQARKNSLLEETNSVVRGTYEEGETEVEVECSLPSGVQKFKIQVGAKVFTEEEINKLYDAFCAEITEWIQGENVSLQEVSDNLNLKESYEGYPFFVEWKSSNIDVVHSDGTITICGEERQEVELRATISYEEWEWEKCFLVWVVPQPLSEEERLYQDIETLLVKSEMESRTQDRWSLPDSWQGEPLVWRRKLEDNGPVLAVCAMIVAISIFLLADKDLHDDVEKRRQKMKRNYPDVVHKLVLYLGAGMTIRGAFMRMVEEYEQTQREGKPQNPIYEELLHTCRELKAGVSEGAAYEHFGKRTGLQEYIRLCTLLTQNLKKGNSTLLQRLREEAAKASLERIQYGKRLGEEAVTKLLLPMVMMLLVVMLMIMIPAFSSVGT